MAVLNLNASEPYADTPFSGDGSALFPAAPVYARPQARKSSVKSNLPLLIGAPVAAVAIGALAWGLMTQRAETPTTDTAPPAQVAELTPAPLPETAPPAAMPRPTPAPVAVTPAPAAKPVQVARAEPRPAPARRAAPARPAPPRSAPDAASASANVSANVPAPVAAPPAPPVVIAAPVAVVPAPAPTPATPDAPM
jgi:hypothetical protein